MVSLAEVDRFLDLIQRGTMSLDQAFQLQEERCRKEHSRPKGNVGARSNPFQRLIVRPFEHLLMGADAALPRPYLANYFDFINFGLAEVIEEYEREARGLIQALLVIHGNNLTWDHFYSDVRTLKLLHRALKELTAFLATPDGTKAWGRFMHRPAGDLPPPGIPQLNQVREALLETHRGLSASA